MVPVTDGPDGDPVIDEHGICDACGGLQPEGARYVADTSRDIDSNGCCRGSKGARGISLCGAVDARTVTSEMAWRAAEWRVEQAEQAYRAR